MSFTMECPFCRARIEAEDEMNGKTAPCPQCGEEVFLDAADAQKQALARLESQPRRISFSEAARAKDSAPAEMPGVTMFWAFDFVLKITLAALVVDGILGLIIVAVVFMFKAATRSRY